MPNSQRSPERFLHRRYPHVQKQTERTKFHADRFRRAYQKNQIHRKELILFTIKEIAVEIESIAAALSGRIDDGKIEDMPYLLGRLMGYNELLQFMVKQALDKERNSS